MSRTFIKVFPYILIIGLIIFIMANKEKDIREDTSPINLKVLKEAQKLADLNFSDPELELALEGLQKYPKDYQDIRKHLAPNQIPPATLFNPIPVGYQFTDRGISKNNYPLTPTEETKEFAFLSVSQLAFLIKNKMVSSVELTQYFLDRLKKHDPELHCVITLTEERAMASARKADEEIAAGNYKGPLHGIPYGAKDLLAVAAYPTTWGAMPYKDQVIEEDAVLIQKLDEAGAILCAKLSLGALAMNDVWFGEKTRNPWDTESGSSGSSAGSASAVSAGLLPFAIGSETYGSIVSPSTVCGTTGLRPTFGRVSRKGAMALSWTMDKLGPIVRFAEDAAIIFEAIYGPDEFDPQIADFPFQYDRNLDLSTLKIGYLKTDFEKEYGFSENDSLSLEVIRSMGVELIPIELPEFPVSAMTLCIEVESATAFEELTFSGRDDLLVNQGNVSWPNFFRQARFIPAVEYVQVNRLRYQMIQEMYKMMQEIDLYIAPSWASSSLPLTNLSGHPAIVVPNGFKEGKPTSITFTGKLFDEGTIIAFARKFQEQTGFQLKSPEKFRN